MGDMADLGITESFQVKRQVLLSASEAAEMILRVDNIIKAAPRWVVKAAGVTAAAAASMLVTVVFTELCVCVCVQEASPGPPPLLRRGAGSYLSPWWRSAVSFSCFSRDSQLFLVEAPTS